MNKVISVGLSCVFASLAIGCSGETIGEDIDQIELESGGGDFRLKSPAFDDGDPTPAEYTCAGNPFATGVSPKLKWKNAPKHTKSFAIVFRDTTPPDVNFQYHWAIWNIPKSEDTVPEGIPGLIPGSTEIVPLPKSLKKASHVQARGIARYFAPCPSNQTTLAAQCGLPPVPPVTDTYTYTIYALGEKDIVVPPHDPAIHPNYVYRLDALFQTMADEEHRAVLTTTSDAIPSTVPFPCPAPAP